MLWYSLFKNNKIIFFVVGSRDSETKTYMKKLGKEMIEEHVKSCA